MFFFLFENIIFVVKLRVLLYWWFDLENVLVEIIFIVNNKEG